MQKGGDPNYGHIKTSKSPWMIEWTEKVKMLYDQQTMEYEEDEDIIHIEQHDIEQDRNISKVIKTSLIKYLEIDGNRKEFRNPTIIIDKKQYERNDIIERRVLDDNYPIPALRGGYGTLTNTRNIPKNTIIGEYMGSMTTEDEWTEIFADSRKDISNRSYVFSFEVTTNEGIERIFIDPIESIMDKGDDPMVLLYITDIRTDIMIKEPTKRDKKRENARFLVVKVNGWPRVFVITTKNIPKNREILIDYGEGFCDLLWDQIRWKRILNSGHRISTEVLNETIGQGPVADLHDYGMNEDNRITIH